MRNHVLAFVVAYLLGAAVQWVADKREAVAYDQSLGLCIGELARVETTLRRARTATQVAEIVWRSGR